MYCVAAVLVDQRKEHKSAFMALNRKFRGRVQAISLLVRHRE